VKLVTLSIAVRPDQRERIVEVFLSLLGPKRVEPGCRRCGIYHEAGNEEALLHLEEWETAEQLERRMRSSRYERLLGAMEASTQPPELRYYTVSEVQGLEYLEAVRSGFAERAMKPVAFPVPQDANRFIFDLPADLEADWAVVDRK
jgi:quinol monooxygenase YgiN